MGAVIIEQKNHIIYITINRPEALNAINQEVTDGIAEGFEILKDNNNLRVGVITAAGEKAFSTGGDLRDLYNLIHTDGAAAERFWKTFNRSPFPFRELGILWKPLIAAVNGYCLAGGLELVLACDIIIASENASFGVPEITLGFIPSAGGTQKLVRRIPFGIALEMLLTGERIDAQEALRIGLINKVVPLKELMPSAEQLAQKIASNGPLAAMVIKELAWRGGFCMSLDEGLRFEKLFSRINRDTDDSKEGALAFIEKRKPQFKGK